jgi:Secretion system C-terminal sorting domain/FG-GAP-like repeat
MRLRIILLVQLLFTITAGAQPNWDREVVSNDTNGPINLAIEDIDGDGDPDVVGSSWFFDQITWSEQTNQGWVSHVVASNFDGNRGVSTADIDLDGDMDILGAAFTDDQIAWFEQSIFGWIKHTVANDFDGALNAIAFDLDLDGDMDILGTAYHDSEVAWWEHLGIGLWEKHVIGSDFWGANEVAVADFDNDGDFDVVACAQEDSEISWWENDSFSWIEHNITTEMYSARGIAAEDMDNDGDIDIIGAGVISDAIFWWENRSATFYKHVVTNRFNGSRQISIADIDNDGDKDIVGTGLWESEISWFENRDGNGSWAKHVIGNDLGLAKGVDTADLDDDGDIDVVGASYSDDQLVSWKQGSGTSPDPITVDIWPSPDPVFVQQNSSFTMDIDIDFAGFHFGSYVLWVEIMLPDGEILSPTYYNEIFMFFGYTIHVNDTHQNVPPNAPVGEYHWTLYVGENDNHAINMGSFRFNVVPAAGAADAGSINDWSMAGFDYTTPENDGLTDGVVSIQPVHEDLLGTAYPNPFNEMVTIPLQLSQQQNARVVIVNTLGQEVATLHSGDLSAGNHELSWNASQLSSGVYFVRAEIAGVDVQMQKLMLLH